MNTREVSAAATSGVLSGGLIIAAIKASGIEYVLSVPDIVTSSRIAGADREGQGSPPHPRLQRG